jgi:flagellar biosynthesis protein FlhF
MKKELPLEVLADFHECRQLVLEWIGRDITVFRPESPGKKPRNIVIVGPTGVGKTTTAIKLAAILMKTGFAERGERPNIVLFSIDAFKIGAKEQLEEYSKIMNVPTAPRIQTAEDMKSELAIHAPRADAIVIDTIGKSPRESAATGEMKETLEPLGTNRETHLAISASMKTRDVYEVMRQFEPFDYRSIIITKLDETRSIGNIISAAIEKEKAISWLTDGQKVPKDIKEADVVSVLLNLDGFEPDWDRLTTRLYNGGAEQP